MQPQSPNSNYDFIMKDGQPAKKGFKLPAPKLPKPILIVGGGLIGLLVVITAYSLITGRGTSASQLYVDALARNQEIVRVSTSVGTLAQDSPTQNLAATTATSLSSEQAQITSYLQSQNIKVSTTALGADMNSATDTQMQTASTSGNLPSTYASYLKTQLSQYETELQAAYKTAGPNAKVILSESFASAQVLLLSPQVANAN